MDVVADGAVHPAEAGVNRDGKCRVLAVTESVPSPTILLVRVNPGRTTRMDGAMTDTEQEGSDDDQ